MAITAAMPSGTGTNIFQKKWPDRFFDVGIAEGHAVTFAGGLATQGIRPVVRDLQHVPAAGLRQHHPRRRGAASAGDLLHGPRGAGGRGRPDPHGAVRHRLHAGGAGHDRHRAQGWRRADRPAQDRAGAQRRALLHPLSARQGASGARAGGRGGAGSLRDLGSPAPRQGPRDPRGRHHGAARPGAPRSSWRPRASTAPWSTAASSSRSTPGCSSC